MTDSNRRISHAALVAYFRRARFGFEGTVARDFTYRVLAELGVQIGQDLDIYGVRTQYSF